MSTRPVQLYCVVFRSAKQYVVKFMMDHCPFDSGMEITSIPFDSQPLTGIEKPHVNDVLCGRGVTTNRHSGNEAFRRLVLLNKVRFFEESIIFWVTRKKELFCPSLFLDVFLHILCQLL
jgi:hypothetical protein